MDKNSSATALLDTKDTCPPEKPRPPCHYTLYVNLSHAANCTILAG